MYLMNEERAMIRKYTNLLLEMLDDGLLDRDLVIEACVKYMSEDDVRGMMEVNELIPDCEDDGQPDTYTEYQDLYDGDDIFDPYF